MLLLLLVKPSILLLIASLLMKRCHPISSNGWSMKDRFSGMRFEIHFNNSNSTNFEINTGTMKRSIQRKADQLACFGWVQDSPKGTLVGEARCNKKMGHTMKTFLLQHEEGNNEQSSSNDFGLVVVEKVTIKDYEDTKIKLHFSHFKILDSRRETCFRDEPHKCENNIVDLL